jgi:hypothetical protein
MIPGAGGRGKTAAAQGDGMALESIRRRDRAPGPSRRPDASWGLPGALGGVAQANPRPGPSWPPAGVHSPDPEILPCSKSGSAGRGRGRPHAAVLQLHLMQFTDRIPKQRPELGPFVLRGAGGKMSYS